MKKFMALLLVCVMVFAFAACGEKPEENPDDDREYGDPIIIGLTIPVTGAQAAGGLQALNGASLAIKQVNDAGGIELSDGWHKVELIYEDDQGDSTLVDTTVRKLVSDGAVAILGPYFSGMTIALDATMRELQVPLVNSATSVQIPPLENPYLWRCRCDDGLNVLILGKAVMDDYTAANGSIDGLKVGILCANDETGTSAATSYKEYFDENGVEYYEDSHNKDDSDLTAYVQKAIAAGCNAWVSSTHDIAAAALAKAMYELGLRDQIVYMNPILAQTEVLNLMEPEWVEGWGCVSDYAFSDTRPGPAAFSAAWVAEYGDSLIPDVQGALFYCHASVVMEAIRRADSFDSNAIRDAIAGLQGFETIIGTVYADEYTNLIYEISIAKIYDLTPTITGSVSMAEELGHTA